jgi:hypothetical protein
VQPRPDRDAQRTYRNVPARIDYFFTMNAAALVVTMNQQFFSRPLSRVFSMARDAVSSPSVGGGLQVRQQLRLIWRSVERIPMAAGGVHEADHGGPDWNSPSTP